MGFVISDTFRNELTDLIRNSEKSPAEQARMISFMEGKSPAKNPEAAEAVSEFISRSEIKATLAHHSADFIKLALHCKDAALLMRQAGRFGDRAPLMANDDIPPYLARMEETALHLDYSPYINYAAYQKDYFLRHYRTFLEGREKAAQSIDLASKSIKTFTTMNDAERGSYVYDIAALQNDPSLIAAAKDSVVAMLELNGGLGSSIGLDPSKHHSKSTGILIPAFLDTNEGPLQVELSIIEAKARTLASLRDSFRELHIFPLNSTITRDGWASFKTSPSLEARTGQRSESSTNSAILKEAGLLFRSEVIQEGFPKISQETLLPIHTGDPDTELAPGGHGQILFELYSSQYLRKLENHGVNVLVIGNADGKQARPHPAVVAKIVKDNIPAALISTDRTPIDSKGGIFAVDDGRLTIIERGQVDEPQLPLFQSIGLQEGDAPQPFNTNTIYVNVPAFLETLEGIEKTRGREAVLQMLMPTTIANKKKVLLGGEEVPVYILEGAIASVVLKFPGVKIFNASAKDRWTQFTPVKKPEDVVYLYYSDVFTVNALSGELRPLIHDPIPPEIALGGWKGWGNLQDTLDAFGRPSMKDLKSLSISGAVFPKNAVFRGRVRIESDRKQIVHLNNALYSSMLPSEHGRLLLEDVSIRIDAEGVMTSEPIENGSKKTEKRFGGVASSEASVEEDAGAGKKAISGGLKLMALEEGDGKVAPKIAVSASESVNASVQAAPATKKLR